MITTKRSVITDVEARCAVAKPLVHFGKCKRNFSQPTEITLSHAYKSVVMINLEQLNDLGEGYGRSRLNMEISLCSARSGTALHIGHAGTLPKPARIGHRSGIVNLKRYRYSKGLGIRLG